MKINNNSYVNMANKIYKNNNINRKKEENKSVLNDRVEISKTGKEIQKYADMMKTSKTNRSDLVDKIKSEIQSGTYKVSSDKLADTILKRMIGEK